MRRNAMSLKKNERACIGILIAPSKLSGFSRFCKFRLALVVHPLPHVGSQLQIQILRHGWQADPRQNFLART